MSALPKSETKPIHVNHTELAKAGKSNYIVICPECSVGQMHLRRDFRTEQLLNWDRCPVCKQLFIFDDIEYIRKNFG